MMYLVLLQGTPWKLFKDELDAEVERQRLRNESRDNITALRKMVVF